MNIHLIAIGGSAMHNIALALESKGYNVTGSDDEIYEPARSRLAAKGLLPKSGWSPEKIHEKLDLVILGMHAKADNPELLKAQELGIKVVSYPEFVYDQSKDKIRIVVAGSHGKTTTTAMIMHVLKYHNKSFDYLVGALLEGFDTMASFSDAPIIVIEGDEYLSSPIDRIPKMLHYKPHIAILTGIAWDHINVFPVFEQYLQQFKLFMESIVDGGQLIYYRHDLNIQNLVKDMVRPIDLIPYEYFPYYVENGQLNIELNKKTQSIKVFGQHNLENMQAAYFALKKVGITDDQFLEAIGEFKGAAKRLQLIKKGLRDIAYLDFAHAPSKVSATLKAIKERFPDLLIFALLELHTFSSLDPSFLNEYAGTLDIADQAIVFTDENALKMKGKQSISEEMIKKSFQNQKMLVINDNLQLVEFCYRIKDKPKCLLFMSSGTFGNLDIASLCEEIIQ